MFQNGYKIQSLSHFYRIMGTANYALECDVNIE